MRKPVRDVQLLAPIGGQRVGRPSTVGRRADTEVYCLECSQSIAESRSWGKCLQPSVTKIWR